MFKKYNIEEIKRYSMDSDDFDRLIRDTLPALTNNEKYLDFESVAEFEWNNYSTYTANVDESDVKGDFYKKYDVPAIMNNKNYLGFHQIICFLCENRIIPFGEYEVKVSW